LDAATVGRQVAGAEGGRVGLQGDRPERSQKNELKPWLKKQYCIPPKESGEFVCRMEDILEVYSRPYDPKRPQICMDEAGKQLVAETRRPLPPKPGKPLRYDYEYERNGTCNLFVFCEPLTGWRHVGVTERKTKQDWAHAVRDLVDVRFPEAEKIVLVMDNLNTHSPASLYETFPPEEARRIAEKLEVHPTPKHGSWLNIAEIMIGIMNRQCLSGRIGDTPTVRDQVAAWEEDGNAHAKPVQWRFTTENARVKLKRLYPTL
jgi:hypothetical protein